LQKGYKKRAVITTAKWGRESKNESDTPIEGGEETPSYSIQMIRCSKKEGSNPQTLNLNNTIIELFTIIVYNY
jgi:hypothetical protein